MNGPDQHRAERVTRARLGKLIVAQFRSSLKDDVNDIHAKMMSRYQEAPEWWYVVRTVLMREQDPMILV